MPIQCRLVWKPSCQQKLKRFPTRSPVAVAPWPPISGLLAWFCKQATCGPLCLAAIICMSVPPHASEATERGSQPDMAHLGGGIHLEAGFSAVAQLRPHSHFSQGENSFFGLCFPKTSSKDISFQGIVSASNRLRWLKFWESSLPASALRTLQDPS